VLRENIDLIRRYGGYVAENVEAPPGGGDSGVELVCLPGGDFIQVARKVPVAIREILEEPGETPEKGFLLPSALPPGVGLESLEGGNEVVFKLPVSTDPWAGEVADQVSPGDRVVVVGFGGGGGLAEIAGRIGPAGRLFVVDTDALVFHFALSRLDFSRFIRPGTRLIASGMIQDAMMQLVFRLADEVPPEELPRVKVFVNPAGLSCNLFTEDKIGDILCYYLFELGINQLDRDIGRKLKDISPTVHGLARTLWWIAVLSAHSLVELWNSGRARPVTGGKVSFVVVAWNRWELTRRCINSLLQYCDYPDREIIVVDNGSTDFTPRALRTLARDVPGFRVITNRENLGVVRARMQGAEAAAGDYLCFLDNDAYIEPNNLDSIQTMLEVLNFRPNAALTGCCGNLHYQDDGEGRYQMVYLPGLPLPVSWFSGYCIMVKRRPFFEVGGFRPDLYPFYGYEDAHLSYALRERGYVSLAPQKPLQINFTTVHQSRDYKKGHDDIYRERFEVQRATFHKLWGPRRRLLNAAKDNRVAGG